MTYNFRKQLFGLNCAVVEQLLDQQQMNQQSEISRLEAALAAEETEQERLRRLIADTQEQIGREHRILEEQGRFQAGAEATIALAKGAVTEQIVQLSVRAEHQRQTLLSQLADLDETVLFRRRALEDWLGDLEAVLSRAPQCAADAALNLDQPDSALVAAAPFRPVFPGQSSGGSGAPTIPESLHEFLVGKVVGHDLHSTAGRLVASRGAAITPELTAQVLTEGLLPDLIQGLAWPGEIEVD